MLGSFSVGHPAVKLESPDKEREMLHHHNVSAHHQFPSAGYGQTSYPQYGGRGFFPLKQEPMSTNFETTHFAHQDSASLFTGFGDTTAYSRAPDNAAAAAAAAAAATGHGFSAHTGNGHYGSFPAMG